MKDSMTSQQRAGLYTITITQFSLVFMLSAVAVAVPTMGREFGAKASELGLVESAYISSVAMLLFPVTRLADWLGRSFVFALGVAVFTVVSVLLPVTRTIDQFNFLRVFQGAGGAMMVSTGLAILADLFPHGQGRGKALGIASAGVYLGLSAGPWLGGLITTYLGWRYIFYIGAVPCAICLVVTLRSLRWRPRRTSGVRFDWLGALLCGAGMVLLSHGGSHFHDLTGRLMLLGAIMFLVAFVAWEARSDCPLVDLKLFAGNKAFAYGSGVQFISYAATFGITFLVSVYLQMVLGLSASQAGLILLAQPVMQVLFSPLGGNMADRWPPHQVAALGMVLATLGLGTALMLSPESARLLVVVALALCGSGTAVFATANTTVIMGSVGASHYGVASAMVAAARTTGMTVSLVSISVVLALTVGAQAVDLQSMPQFMSAMRIVLTGFVFFSALGIVMCLKAPLLKRAE
ncbi:MFS transporter [Desulfovibrio ferrophilus]|uniref:Putative Drug resistance transporter n=1 Tax=Desulfovibrio ferrophilus TaxID=241368 RepID=A0A2Z6B2D1_9BACT|nr:MFS transporter [Desulfovibrio ferrophilus]BBD09613.1 putative Drug resistance transporter [Desulfovibrio ferrophilus]